MNRLMLQRNYCHIVENCGIENEKALLRSLLLTSHGNFDTLQNVTVNSKNLCLYSYVKGAFIFINPSPCHLARRNSGPSFTRQRVIFPGCMKKKLRTCNYMDFSSETLETWINSISQG
ncbi:unnamed protein product [Larinioides sclopetarius]